MTINETVLGPEGLTYLREQLGFGRSLSLRLLGQVDQRGGRVRTWLPSGVDEETRVPLSNGGVFRAGVSYIDPVTNSVTNPDRILTDLLLRFLGEHQNALVLFENPVSEADDPGLSELESRILLMDDEVYHVLEHRDADRQMIETAIGEATAASGFLAALSESSRPLPTGRGERLSSSELDELASRCAGVICAAYDGESFIIWTQD